MSLQQECAKELLGIVPKTMRAIRTHMRAAAQSELTVPQFRIFNYLARHKTTNGELAEWMGVTAPTMTRMVDALEKRRLITRQCPDQDKRQVTLTLTPQGRVKYNYVRKTVEKEFEKKLSKLTARQQKDLLEGLLLLEKLFQ